MRSLWLAKKANRSVGMQLLANPKKKKVEFRIIVKQSGEWVDQADPKSQIPNPSFDGTVKRGSATCPCCGYTTPVIRVCEQLRDRHGGANDAALFCVVVAKSDGEGRCYRLPTANDRRCIELAKEALDIKQNEHVGAISLIPNEPLPPQGTLGFRVQRYGITEWGHLFSVRQLLTLVSLVRIVQLTGARITSELEPTLAEAVQTILGIAVSRFTDIFNSLCMWETSKTQVRHLFTRQAVPMLWDFAETNALADAAGNYDVTLNTMVRVLESTAFESVPGHVERSSATTHPLPDDSASAFITDPPYYDAVPYADLSDFFYVWLKRSLPQTHSEAFEQALTPKVGECIVDPVKGKDAAFFEKTMKAAMQEGRRILLPAGIAVVVFAHKSTSGWETVLQAMIEAGWIITGSWPIDTELGNRLRAQGSAALASSVHLVCRPRENADGEVTESVGEWRDVLGELPKRIHEWMPRLAAEGVVGADAIFACLGPALEVFSRYSRVEKANGDTATLREYLEFVWAAVSTEALSLIFKDADAAGLEPDARLTAMWLWTLGGGKDEGGRMKDENREEEAASDDEDEAPAKSVKLSGFTLEYDAARKIAQGLGVHLEQCQTLVEVKGDKARMLPVKERAESLFGKSGSATATQTGGKAVKKKAQQKSLFDELVAEEPASNSATWGDLQGPTAGSTVLDRVHQSMILFAAGRGELLKRFLVEDGIGKDARFWKLAQSLSALYPKECEEKRWVDGVLARKKGLGL